METRNGLSARGPRESRADERVAYTTVQTLVYRLERKGAVRRVKKVGNAQLFESQHGRGVLRGGLVRELLDIFGGSP